MARYNEILVGRYARAIQKLFGIKGEVPVGSLGGELSVTHSVFSGVENRYLEAWDRFGTQLATGPVAAQTNAQQIRNPQNSNVIAVVEFWGFRAGAADTVAATLAANNADLANAATGFRLDSRTARSNSTCVLSQSSASVAALSNQIAGLFYPGATSLDATGIWFEDQEFILLPGDTLRFTDNVVNTLMVTNLRWRERFLEESERT